MRTRRHLRHTRSAVLLAAVAIAAPMTASAQEFEGVITLRAPAGSGGAPSPDMEYMSRAGRVRMNVRSPMGVMSIIAIPAEKKMLMVMDQQRAYSEVPMQLDGAARGGDAPVITRTGRKETIAGHECEHLTVVSGRDTADVCVAKGLGSFLSMLPGGARSAPAWQRQMMAEGAFPLKVVSSNGTTQLEVTRIERKKLSERLFDVPDDYQKMEMPRRPPGRP